MKLYLLIFILFVSSYSEIKYDFKNVLRSEGNSFYFDCISLSDTQNTWIIKNYNDRNGDIENVKIVLKIDSSIMIILDEYLITSYRVLDNLSNEFKTIVLYEDNYEGGYETDTIHFNGVSYDTIESEFTNNQKITIEHFSKAIQIMNQDTSAIDQIYSYCLKLYRKGEIVNAASILYSVYDNKSMKELFNRNILALNDLGFLLEESKEYLLAIDVLSKVIEIAPNRTVAYLNMGDAWLGYGDTTKAIGYYKTYIAQMKEKGIENQIPERVMELLKE